MICRCIGFGSMKETSQECKNLKYGAQKQKSLDLRVATWKHLSYDAPLFKEIVERSEYKKLEETKQVFWW
jgi:hypothetical protein